MEVSGSPFIPPTLLGRQDGDGSTSGGYRAPHFEKHCSMGKLLDLDAFDGGQKVRKRRMIHSISEIVRLLGFSRSTVSRVYQKYMGGGQKTSYREQGMNAHHTAPTNLIVLWAVLANVFEIITIERFHKNVKSLNRRLTAIIKARGGPTRYSVDIPN
ncbi:hypothetical protein TNCV_1063481 [Trichonephila clavipes]|nr:hypothetical protein TNCV_1063481 [Trichonephila clavipes]